MLLSKRILLAVAVIGLAGTPSAYALDLVQTYEQARNSDPVFLAAQAKYRADKHILIQASSTMLPTVSGSANASRYETDASGNYDSNGYVLSVTQPIFNFAIFSGIAQARAEVQRAEAEYGSAQQGLMLRVAETYLGALAAQDNVELAQAERSAIERQLEVATGRLNAGLGTITEVHDAKARFQLAEAVTLEAQNRMEDSLDALRELTGEFSDSLKPLKTDIPTVRPQPEDQSQWVQTAQAQNLTIRARLAAFNALRKRVNVERSGHYPSVGLVGKHSQLDTTPGPGTNDGVTNSVAIELTVPIFQGGLVTSRTEQSKHLREAARQELEASRRSTKRQTRTAYAGVISGIKRVDALKQAVVASDSALKAKNIGFEAGINTNIDVLDAQRDLFKAKRDYAQTRYTYILDLLRLKNAAGQLNENDIKEINGWLQ